MVLLGLQGSPGAVKKPQPRTATRPTGFLGYQLCKAWTKTGLGAGLS